MDREPMRVYFVGPQGSDFATYERLMAGHRVMYSFATCRTRDLPAGNSGYALDSGAFTAWKQGRAVNMARLVEWYERHDAADFRMMLDEIGGDEGTQRRLLHEIEKMGQRVVPVFHGPGCESWAFFDELCERYPIIGLGCVLPDNTSAAATEWLSRVFDRVCDPDGFPRVRLHGLRMTSRMGDFPFASVDGSTWVVASKNGLIPAQREDGRLIQIRAPWLSNVERQELWVKAWDRQPKCERRMPRPSPRQFSMFGEESAA